MQKQRLKVDGNLLVKSSNPEQSTCLEILPPDGECPKLSALSLVNLNTRAGSAGKVKKAPFVNQANSGLRRTPTPTKQIILEAAKRKQNLADPVNECASKEADSRKKQSHSGRNGVRRSEDGKVETGAKKNKDHGGHGQNEDDEPDDDEDDDDEDSSEDEPLKAPNDLMIEFLDCVMNSDYDNGLKLCKMILLYEPENAEALNFKRLIEEKIAIDAATDEESDDSNENNNDNSEDGNSNDSDNSSDSETEESTEDDDDDKDDDDKNRDGKQNKYSKQNKDSKQNKL